MGIVKATKLIFDYITRDEEDKVEEVKRAINNLNIDITQGDFVAILGHNGSGKSTFAKQLKITAHKKLAMIYNPIKQITANSAA